MGRGPGGGGTGANGQDRERMGRDDREKKQGAGDERGRRRKEEADRGRIDRTPPTCTPYTLQSLPIACLCATCRTLPTRPRMLCYVMGYLYYSEKGVLGDDSETNVRWVEDLER